MTQVHGFLCGPKIYEVDGIQIERPGSGGPCPLRKDGEPKMRFSKADKAALDKFWDMSEEEKDKHRVGGGCRSF